MSSRNSNPAPLLVDLKRGFLPSEDPLLRLPEGKGNEFDFNIQLNLTAHELPSLIKDKLLRSTINAMNETFISPSVSIVNINMFDCREVDNAMMLLTMLIQAYIWEEPTKPARIIPRILAENMLELLRHNSRVPVLTYSDYALQNWRRIDESKGITLDNIEPLYTFTGSSEEAWFIKIHVAVEAAFAEAMEAAYKIRALANMPEAVENRAALFARYFMEMAQSIEQATAVLGKMYDHCSSEFFFNVLRPYLEGTDKAGGIIFDLRDKGAQGPVMYRGSSGAQSSTVPALDAILGVKHADDKMTRSLRAFLEYMPNLHKAFIDAMQNNHVPDSDERRRAMIALWQFRKDHERLPDEYITVEAARNGISLEKATKGTGSTDFSLFLSKRTRDTLEAAIQQGGGPVAKL